MEKKSFVSKYIYSGEGQSGVNISWSSIFAGVVTFIAVTILCSLIGVAVGLGAPTFTAENPFEGVGVGLIIWAIVSLVVAVGASGFIAGLTANRAGLIHGFLSWALNLFVVVLLASTTVSGAFGLVGNVLGMTGNAVGSAVSDASGVIGSISEDAFSAITENISNEVDFSGLDEDVINALEKSDNEVLHPGYLQGQLEELGTEVTEAGKKVLIEGEDTQVVFDELSTSIQNRVEGLSSEINEEDLKALVSDNTDLSAQEVDQAVENIVTSYTEMTEKVTVAYEQAQTELDSLRDDLDKAIEEARVAAEEASKATAKYALYVFVGLLIAMVVSALAGHLGAASAQKTIG